MKREQDPRDEDTAEAPAPSTDLDGRFERDRGGELEPPDGGSGGGNTTKSDI